MFFFFDNELYMEEQRSVWKSTKKKQTRKKYLCEIESYRYNVLDKWRKSLSHNFYLKTSSCSSVGVNKVPAMLCSCCQYWNAIILVLYRIVFETNQFGDGTSLLHHRFSLLAIVIMTYQCSSFYNITCGLLLHKFRFPGGTVHWVHLLLTISLVTTCKNDISFFHNPCYNIVCIAWEIAPYFSVVFSVVF